jgi:hypothetical protein
MPDTSVLVVSCDKYADLWNPFFAIFWKRWPDCPYPVYLGTNHLTYSDPRITSLPVGDDESWTTGLRRMLDRVGADHVVLFLEDFLIRRPVETASVRRFVGIAREKGLGCLRLAALLPLALPPTEPVVEFPELGVIPPGDPCRVTAQVAIWKVAALRQLLVPGLSAWEFEEFGTRLSTKMPEAIWGTYEPVIDYAQCVEKGKWKPEGLAICHAAGVDVEMKARTAFTEDELRDHLLASERGSRLSEIQREALASFRAGRRIDGLRSVTRCLRVRPHSVRLWGIAFFGLLGPKPLEWLEDRNLAWKITRIRMKRR